MQNSAPRILVIEDDPDTASELDTSLGAAGYDITVAREGEKALSFGHSNHYVAMTVERMLPDIDGIEVVRRLRDDGITTPALMISALGDVADRVKALQEGADDYLVKPFDVSEMLARVDALCRRVAYATLRNVLRIGDLEMDLLGRRTWRAGRQIELRPREFQLLEYLVRHANEVISRSQLLQHVWGLEFDPSTNIIDVYIGRLRRKIDNEQPNPIIHTIRRSGFCVRT
jgi:two-component system, OmpR family, response regulator